MPPVRRTLAGVAPTLMTHKHHSIIPLLGFAIALGTVGCDTKVNQCNKLIDVVNKHTTTLSTSIEKLADVQNNPAVADEFATTVKLATDDISALQFSDEKVMAFSKSYLELLGQADKVGKAMAEAAKSGNVESFNKANEEADKVVKLEDTIVKNVNEYCQAP
jgi:hypothetical protein